MGVHINHLLGSVQTTLNPLYRGLSKHRRIECRFLLQPRPLGDRTLINDQCVFGVFGWAIARRSTWRSGHISESFELTNSSFRAYPIPRHNLFGTASPRKGRWGGLGGQLPVQTVQTDRSGNHRSWKRRDRSVGGLSTTFFAGDRSRRCTGDAARSVSASPRRSRDWRSLRITDVSGWGWFRETPYPYRHY